MSKKNCYEILGINQNTSGEEIFSACHKLHEKLVKELVECGKVSKNEEYYEKIEEFCKVILFLTKKEKSMAHPMNQKKFSGFITPENWIIFWEAVWKRF